MTLILCCITPRFALQVSDRRLTWLNGPSVGAVADDARNKAVVVCNRVAFAYSGLAQIGRQRTDDWLLDVSRGVVPYNPQQLLETVRQEATSAFAAMTEPRSIKHHAFVAVGWARVTPAVPRSPSSADDVPFRPFIASISNALTDEWEWRALPEAGFTTQFHALGDGAQFVLASAGAALGAPERMRIRREVQLCADHGVGPAEHLRVLAEAMRRIAARNGSVGRTMLATCLPREALAHGSGLTMPLVSPVSWQDATALYFPDDGDEGVRYGPHYTCEGTAMADLEVRYGPDAGWSSPTRERRRHS